MIRILTLLLLTSSGLSAQDQELRTRIKQTLFAADPLPSLKPESHGSFEPEPGVIAERISYGTQFDMRIPAILYRPKTPRAQSPAIIVVNGHGGDKYSWYPFYAGILYARAGAFVLTYDPTGEGERNMNHQSGTRAHDKVELIPELGQSLGGLMLTDVRQAVSYLSQRTDVDPKRIAAVGYSMGSFVLGIACAVETRLKACVLVGGGNLDGPGGYWDGSKPMCQGFPYKALTFLGDRPTVLYSLHASRGPTLVYNGLEDTTVAIPRFGEVYFRELQDRVAKARGKREGVFDAMFHPGTGHRPYFVTKPVARWLEQHLDFPNWTASSIEGMPTTHISEWARANSVDMDPLYATEHREGGTPGLGAGIPGVKRSQLDVFSADEWKELRPMLVHETWRQKARER
ncbi:MAG TPA: alpha/beta fold hydrolase [Bryobacteraceae bacterium]|nr:alpha/beta fold hydrolase [Bryobacteraceae bacterium]